MPMLSGEMKTFSLARDASRCKSVMPNASKFAGRGDGAGADTPKHRSATVSAVQRFIGRQRFDKRQCDARVTDDRRRSFFYYDSRARLGSRLCHGKLRAHGAAGAASAAAAARSEPDHHH